MKMCESKDLIVGYLYGELSREEKGTFESHLAVCTDCRIEIEELRSTRTHLALWAPPEPDLGFRVIRGSSAPAPALPRRSRLVPAFAFAAAAVIVLAAAAAIGNIEVRYGNMTVRAGRGGDSQPGSPGGPASGTPPSQPVVTASSPDFAALDRRLKELEAALSAGGTQLASAAPSSAPSAARLSDAEIFRQVREMVRAAEARQETAVAQRLLQVTRDFDYLRRADIAMIQQGLGQYQGLANAEIAQNRDMLNQLVRAASNKQEK
jgi:hypothetical protein